MIANYTLAVIHMRLGQLGEFALGIGGAIVLMMVAVAVWYAFSYAVLLAVGRALPLRGRKSPGENGSNASAPRSSDEPSPTQPPKR